MSLRITKPLATLALALFVASCGGGANKPLSSDDWRIFDVYVGKPQAYVRFQNETGEKWVNYVGAFLERCVLPAFPDGFEMNATNVADGVNYYFTKPGSVDDKSLDDGDYTYGIALGLNRRSNWVADKGDPTAQGSATGQAAARYLFGQMKSGQLKKDDNCPPFSA